MNPLPPTKRPDLFSRLGKSAASHVSTSGHDLVSEAVLHGHERIPWTICPKITGVDLIGWAQANRDLVKRRVAEHGAVLLRGFTANSQAHFEAFVRAMGIEVMDYVEGATPRTKVGKEVYTSTEFPADQVIAPHNELSYVLTWPSTIVFFCEVAAKERGETPIVDCGRVFERIPASVQQRFLATGWTLIRNYGTGLGLPWQRAFRTDSRADLERYLDGADIKYEWLGSDRLRTYQTRPAILRQRQSGRNIWFNHVAFWNVWSLPEEVREGMLAAEPVDSLPYNTTYGDGSPIDREVVDLLNRAYEAETVSFRWQIGDVLYLDNNRVAHARNSFVGPRRILTAMGDPFSDRGLS